MLKANPNPFGMKLIIFLFILVPLVANAQTKVKVACIGNSITEGAGIESDLRYPAQLQKMLGENYEVKNFGLGGRTLLRKGDAPYWHETAYQEALSWTPDVVIIKLGTNDTKPQNWIYAEDFESDYKDFIDSFKKLPGKRKIFVCTPVPVFKDGWGITGSIVSDELIPILKKVAKSENATLIDLHTPLEGKSELFPDGIHPDAGGATLIAEEIFKVLDAKIVSSVSK